MAFDIKDYFIGLADITYKIGETEQEIPAQADAAVLTITPAYVDIANYELGLLDQLVDSYEVNFEATFDSRTAMLLGLPVKKTTGSGADAGKENFVDEAIGSSLRTLKGGELVIHPRIMGTDVSKDVTIFCAVPTGAASITYGKEKGNVKVTWKALVKDGATVGAKGNFFRVGPDFTNV